MVDKKSRYARTATVTVTDLRGEELTLLDVRTRGAVEARFEHTPVAGERLDHLSHRYYRDPLKFHQIADASEHLDPFDVVAPTSPVPIPPDR